MKSRYDIRRHECLCDQFMWLSTLETRNCMWVILKITFSFRIRTVPVCNHVMCMFLSFLQLWTPFMALLVYFPFPVIQARAVSNYHLGLFPNRPIIRKVCWTFTYPTDICVVQVQLLGNMFGYDCTGGWPEWKSSNYGGFDAQPTGKGSSIS